MCKNDTQSSMKPPFPLRRIAVGVLATAACAGSWALGIGRAQGLALIGRPLDITVPLLLDAGEAPAECLAAEVFYGDERLRSDRLNAELVDGRAIRVRSSRVVDEPVVTLHLQVGCVTPLARRLVLLAEQPDPQGDVPRAEAPSRALAQAPAEPMPPVTRPASVVGRPLPPARATTPAVPAAAPSAARAARPPAQQAARPAVAASAARPERAAAPQPRLKLEAADLVAGEPALRSSVTLGSVPSQEASPQQRAAALALWKALNAQPEELLRESQRLASLESDLQALRQSIQRNDKSLTDLRAELQDAQQERYANPVVYSLLALLAASMGVAAWAWRRGSAGAQPQTAEDRPWWKRPSTTEDPEPGEASAGNAGHAHAAGAFGRGHPDSLLSQPGHSGPDAFLQRPVTDRTLPVRRAHGPNSQDPDSDSFRMSGRGGDDFPFSQPSQLRSLKAEELHDVQQEADFFVSLGEYERAIDVLRSHIAANPQTSPIAWLDLMDIYHRLGRREDYDWTRGEFQRTFNADVPPFDAFTDEGPGLEQYENAIMRIVSLWSSRRVLDVIEESIFRGPAQDGTQAFSLPAYRELLLLHHVATEVYGSEDAAGRASSFGDSGLASIGAGLQPGFNATQIHPLSAAVQPAVLPLPSQPVPFSTVAPLATLSDFAPPSLDLPQDLDIDAPLDINLDEPAQAGMMTAEPLIGDSVTSVPGDESNLLDFDLPGIDTSGFTTRKPRE